MICALYAATSVRWAIEHKWADAGYWFSALWLTFFLTAKAALIWRHPLSTTIQDVEAQLLKTSADMQTLLSLVSTQITSLREQIATLEAATTPDLTAILTSIQALDSTIDAAITTYTPIPVDPGTAAKA